MQLVSRGFSVESIRWHLSLAQIHAFLHVHEIQEGRDLIWPETALESLDDLGKASRRFRQHLTRART